MSHDPYDINKTYSIGFQGVSALDFIRYKTPTGEWRCLYRTETVNLTGDCLYANQEGIRFHSVSSGTHCFTQLTGECDVIYADNDNWLVSDSGQPLATNCYDDVIGSNDITTSSGEFLETDQALRIAKD